MGCGCQVAGRGEQALGSSCLVVGRRSWVVGRRWAVVSSGWWVVGAQSWVAGGGREASLFHPVGDLTCFLEPRHPTFFLGASVLGSLS